MTQVIKKALVKTTLWGLLLCLLLTIAAFGALQTPYVQTLLTKKLAQWVSNNSSFQLSIDRVEINWLDEITLRNLEVKDQQDSLMIGAPRVEIDFHLTTLLTQGDIFLQGISLHDAGIHLIKNTPDQDFNINLFIRELNALAKSEDSESKPPAFNLSWAELENTTFSFNDPEKDSIPGQFDYYHFQLKDLKGKLTNFNFNDGVITLNARHLQAYEPVNDFKIDTLKTRFMTSDSLMRFEDLLFVAGNSRLQDELIFEYDSYEAFSDFNRLVHIEAQLNESNFHSHDLTLFAPSLSKYEDLYKVSGVFKGTVDNFSLKNMRLTFGRYSWMNGSLSFFGLPNISEAFFDFKVKKGKVLDSDLAQYLPAEVNERLAKFNSTKFNGTVQGFFTDFVANGSFDTRIGKFSTDINLKFPEKGLPAYSGKLITKNFEFGKLIGNDSLFQQIDLKGKVQGKGFNLEEADFNLNATIDRLGIKNYDYKNIKTNARLAKELFEGNLSVNDENLQVVAEGLVDLRNGKNKIDVDLKLDTADLHNLNLSAQPLSLKTQVKLDFNGLQLDSITGQAAIYETSLSFKNKPLYVDHLEVSASKDSLNNRTISLHSEALNAKASGNFYFSDLIRDLKRTYKEYTLNFQNNSADIKAYYTQKTGTEHEEYELKYEAQLHDINPWLKLFDPEIYLSPKTKVDGRFRNGFTTILTFNTEIDSLSYNQYQLMNTLVDLSTSKISDSTNVLAMAYLASEQQAVQGREVTKNFEFEGIWDKSRIEFRSEVEQTNLDNRAKLTGEIDFLKDTTLLHFNESEFKILETIWKVDPANQLVFANHTVQVDDLKLQHEAKVIAIEGKIAHNPIDSLSITLKNLRAQMVNPLLAEDKLRGTINGKVVVKDLYGRPIITNHLEADDFYINEFLVGDLYSDNFWDQTEKQLNVDFFIHRNDKKIIQVQGGYKPSDLSSPLNLTASFDSAHLDVAEPFIDALFTDLKGIASGSFTITGQPSRPILKGKGSITGGQVNFSYLNTLYTFDGDIIMDVNEIGVRNVRLKDINQNAATLSGGIFHDGFQDFILDLSADLDNFQVLNTTSRDNPLYYGQAFATGELSVLGAINNLYISANATTNKNTKIYIPLGTYSDVEVEQEDFIHFINLKDSSLSKQREEIDDVDLSGIKLDFDLDITQDAYCEMIFDIKSGDIIRGRGNGKLKLQIDTQGEFNMFGDYEFTEGGYNFTLQNIINKEFKIEKGSRINWLGDPYAGQLDMKASYTQMASIEPVVKYLQSGNSDQTKDETAPSLSRKYPVIVLMDIEGNLLSPDINFDITFDEVPNNLDVMIGVSLEAAIRNFKNQMESDEQELKRQVFSLIILRKLSDPNSFSPGQNSVESSLSEFLSNQLSYWVSQIDDNLEIDLDINEINSETFKTFQLRLSYSLLDGRLRVTRDGGFTDIDNQTNLNSIVGEWTVEYLITPDGRLRAKMYNRNNLNQTTTDLGYANSAGVSVMHIQSFSQLEELFSIFRKKAKDQKSNEEEKSEEDKSLEEPDLKRPEEEELRPELKEQTRKDKTEE